MKPVFILDYFPDVEDHEPSLMGQILLGVAEEVDQQHRQLQHSRLADTGQNPMVQLYFPDDKIVTVLIHDGESVIIDLTNGMTIATGCAHNGSIIETWNVPLYHGNFMPLVHKACRLAYRPTGFWPWIYEHMFGR